MRLAIERNVSTVTSGILLAALASASFSSAGFIASQLIDETRPGVVLAFYEGAFGLLFVLGVNARALTGAKSGWRPAMPWVIGSGLVFAVAIGTFYTALERLPFSTAAPIVGAVPLASYTFVLLLLRGQERITPRALLGAVLVVGGVGLVGVSA